MTTATRRRTGCPDFDADGGDRISLVARTCAGTIVLKLIRIGADEGDGFVALTKFGVAGKVNCLVEIGNATTVAKKRHPVSILAGGSTRLRP